MPLSRPVRLALPLLAGLLALGQAAPLAASVAVDATGASVEGPEAGPTVRELPIRGSSHKRHAFVIASAKGATNLRATPSALWVMGVEARR